jgi:hypothetical protein
VVYCDELPLKKIYGTPLNQNPGYATAFREKKLSSEVLVDGTIRFLIDFSLQ